MDKNNYISIEEKFSVLLYFFFRMRGKGVDNRTKLKVLGKKDLYLIHQVLGIIGDRDHLRGGN